VVEKNDCIDTCRLVEEKNVVMKRINTSNERYNNKEIDVEKLLNSSSLLVVKRK
jgi:hypothetical protein